VTRETFYREEFCNRSGLTNPEFRCNTTPFHGNP